MRRQAFTLIELLTVIAVIAILAAILMPALGGVRQRAEVTKGFSNLRQVHAASMLYGNDNLGRVPPAQDTTVGEDWMQILGPYLGQETDEAASASAATNLPSDVLISPRWNESPRYVPDPTLGGYGMNTRLLRPTNDFANQRTGSQNDRNVLFSQIPFPATTVFIGESADWHFETSAMDLERWSGESHVLYADGRVESALPEKVRRLVADPSNF